MKELIIQDDLLESSSEDLMQALQELEAHLENFRQNIAPQVEKLGINLGVASFLLGANLQAVAFQNYDSIVSKISANGYYDDNDIMRLDSALEQEQLGRDLAFIGLLVGAVLYFGSKLWKMFKEYWIKQKMISYIEAEKTRVPIVRKKLATVDSQNYQRIEARQKVFAMVGSKISDRDDLRREIHAKLSNLVDGFKKSSEVRSKSMYINDLYGVIDAFDVDEFSESLERLLFTGIQKKGLYVVRSLDYTNNIETALSNADWEKPYYMNGLPEIVIFCIRNRKNRSVFPKGYKSKSLKNAITRIQKETLAIFNPIELFRSIRFARKQIGSVMVPFKHHYKFMIILILISATYYLAMETDYLEIVFANALSIF